MKKILSLIYLIGFIQLAFAQDSTKTTVFLNEPNRKLLQSIAQIQPLHYKLHYEAFLVNYAFDDTSAALINLFFSKRHNTRWGFLGMDAGLLVLALAGSTQEDVCITKPTYGTCLAEKQRVYQPWVTPVFLVGMGGALTYVIVRLSAFSRQRLVGILKDYANGKPIPPRIKMRLLQKYFPVMSSQV